MSNTNIKQHKGQYLKESNILASISTIKQQQKEVLLNTKGQYMKESNILADNATIKQQQKEVFLDIKGQYMKEQTGKLWWNLGT